MKRFAILCALLPTLAGACAGRTAPATQSAALFDQAKSDPKAVAIADQVMTAVGGEAAWAAAKEIIWTQGIIVDGKLISVRKHAWDRWNGRHQFTRLDPNGGIGVTMHELFSDTASVMVIMADGRPTDVIRSDKVKMVDEANKAFYPDSYMLMLPMKLKDPGVHLTYVEEAPEYSESAVIPKDAPMKYDVIKITFDKGVGQSMDTYYLLVDKTTHLPGIIERVAEGKPDTARSGFRLDNWVDAGGLKFATQRVTLGYTKADAPKTPLVVPDAWKDMVPFEGIPVPNPGELVIVGSVVVHGEPDDTNYVPKVL